MKIGIISDIHAQLEPLIKALKLLEREKVDLIVCAGDVVEKGFDGDKVVRLLQALMIPCVRGNHDEAAVSNQRWWRKQLDAETVKQTLQQLRNGKNPNQSTLLTDETLFYLQTLPFSRTYEWEGKRVLLAHGSPRSNSTYLMPEMPGKKLAELLDDIDVDIFICGHTHRPMWRDVGNISILNPGAVSIDKDRPENHTVGILTLPEMRYHIYSLITGKIYRPST